MVLESLAINYAADEHPIIFDRSTLHCFSSCARGLPAAAEEWDVSGLLVEGKVQRQTVVDYLNAISKLVHSEVVIAEDTSEGPPAVTLARLASLLAFADAVGSSRGLLLALDAESTADRLVAEVTCSQERIQLQLDGCYYCGELSLWVRQTQQHTPVKLGTASSAEDRVNLCKQLAQQLEAALHLAYKLQLPKLLAVLKAFMKRNSTWTNSVLSTAELLQTVLSTRVLDVSTSSLDLQQAVTLSYTSELCSFKAGRDLRHLLQPIGLTAQQKQPIKFEATVMEDFSTFTKGQVIDVELDTLGSRLKVGAKQSIGYYLRAQLMLGNALNLMSKDS